MRTALTGAYALACALFLGLALHAQDVLFRLGFEYYLRITGTPTDARGFALCELDALFQQLGATGSGSQVVAGACDAVLVSGLVAVGGLLAYLVVYLAFCAGTRALLWVLPRRWRTWGLIAASVVFLLIALPLQVAMWLLDFGMLLCFAASLPIARRVRAVLLVGLFGAFYVAYGPAILALTLDRFLYAHLVYLGDGGAAAWPAGVRDLLQFLNLGNPGLAHQEGDGFPYLLPALGLLVTLPRRIAWVAYELWVGRARRLDVAQLFLYLLGLPFLIGNAASPSYEDFRRDADPSAPALDGWRTLAASLGQGALLYTLLVGLGYSPAVRLLFPRCDLDLVSPAWVWARLVLSFVIAWLYLVGTEQTSVGVCRLFGYRVRDNYQAPLYARNVADFWRRWNVLWRDFLVRVLFFPTAMGLARRSGDTRPWHLAVATAVTFVGSYALNALPLLLLSLRGMVILTDGVHPGPGLTHSLRGLGAEHSVPLTHLLPALGLYYALEGTAVAWNLFWEARPPRRRLPRLAAVTMTLLFLSLVRVLLDPMMNLAEKAAMVARALNL